MFFILEKNLKENLKELWEILKSVQSTEKVPDIPKLRLA